MSDIIPIRTQKEAALKLVQRRRLAVFPCRPRSKEPLTLRGCKDASRDENQVRRWWRRWPDANIGVATGEKHRLMVVIVAGPEGEKQLALFEKEFCTLPVTVESRWFGDRHLWFALPKGSGPIPSSDKEGGFNIQADGGYVLAPPSILDDYPDWSAAGGGQ